MPADIPLDSPPKGRLYAALMEQLPSRHLFDLTMETNTPLDLGACPTGGRRLITVRGGEFIGQRARGRVIGEGASDLLVLRANGSFQQDVRIVLRTHDDALILMTYRGIRHASPEIMERLARGEDVSSDQYYLRTAPFFETAAPAYSWLNDIVAVAHGERRSGGVSYRVFEIL